jgi:hypothetical protein
MTLVIFAAVNAALFALKRRSHARRESFEVSQIVPITGCGLCLSLIIAHVLD